MRFWKSSGAPSVRTAVGQKVFARAHPQKVSITEKYRFRQELSVNPSLSRAEKPATGRIHAVVPFDGEKYFSRSAVADVKRQVERLPEGQRPVEATIGHLVLANVGDVLRADGSPLAGLDGSIPLVVPVRRPEIRDVDLQNDRHQADLTIDYAPQIASGQPLPVRLEFMLLDPEDGLINVDESRSWREGKKAGDLPDQIVRQPAFSSELSMSFQVTLTWPKRSTDGLEAHIRHVSLKWPTLTSLAPSALQFFLSGVPAEIQYNPVTSSLEWNDIAFDRHGEDQAPAVDEAEDGSPKKPKKSKKAKKTEKTEKTEKAEKAGPSATAAAENNERGEADDADQPNRSADIRSDGRDGNEDDHEEQEEEDGAMCRLFSPFMDLVVRQPGQLRSEEKLEGAVEIEVDELLSGLDPRLFDASGRRFGHDVLRTSTRLRLEFVAFLEDEFSRRNVSATHTLHFDEIVPEGPRIEDIMAALRDRGFNVEMAPLGGIPGFPQWLVRATRVEGPNEILLLLVVRGRRSTTRRRAEIPGWHRYTSEFDSGELRITIYGRVPRDTKELTSEVNELRKSLTAQFRHVQAQR